MADKKNPIDYFSPEARDARRKARIEKTAALSGAIGRSAASRYESADERITTQNAGLRAVAFVRELLNNYRLPTMPRLSYSGLRGGRTAANSSKVLDGVITINAAFKTSSNVNVSFDVPVEIRDGKMIEPSVIVHDGAPRIIAQSTFSEIVERHTASYEMPVREMYSKPLDQNQAKGAYENRIKLQRMNRGMFSVENNRNRIRAAINKTAYPLKNGLPVHVVNVVPDNDYDDDIGYTVEFSDGASGRLRGGVLYIDHDWGDYRKVTDPKDKYSLAVREYGTELSTEMTQLENDDISVANEPGMTTKTIIAGDVVEFSLRGAVERISAKFGFRVVKFQEDPHDNTVQFNLQNDGVGIQASGQRNDNGTWSMKAFDCDELIYDEAIYTPGINGLVEMFTALSKIIGGKHVSAAVKCVTCDSDSVMPGLDICRECAARYLEVLAPLDSMPEPKSNDLPDDIKESKEFIKDFGHLFIDIDEDTGEGLVQHPSSDIKKKKLMSEKVAAPDPSKPKVVVCPSCKTMQPPGKPCGICKYPDPADKSYMNKAAGSGPAPGMKVWYHDGYPNARMSDADIGEVVDLGDGEFGHIRFNDGRVKEFHIRSFDDFFKVLDAGQAIKAGVYRAAVTKSPFELEADGKSKEPKPPKPPKTSKTPAIKQPKPVLPKAKPDRHRLCSKCNHSPCVCPNGRKKKSYSIDAADMLAKIKAEAEQMESDGLSHIDVKQAIFKKYGPDLAASVFGD